jgi:phosphate transport system substrate-binding protein
MMRTERNLTRRALFGRIGGAAGLVGLGLARGLPAWAEESLTGAGSTFVYPVLAKWSEAYHTKTGVAVNYQSIGSGGGIAQIKAGTVDFGASDMPLQPADLRAAGLVQFPLVVGAVVPVVNLPGLAPGALRLSGPLLADIFLGRVKKWQDPEITSLNPGLALPDLPITVVHRSDGSGTTFTFVDYLAKVSPEWRARIGVSTAVSWPVGVGGKGNEGVAAFLQRIKGGIGYLEYAYVKQNALTYALLQNAAGRFPPPERRSFQAAAASAEWTKAEDFALVITNAPGEEAYPVAGVTFVLMHRQSLSTPRGKAALDFFRWVLKEGGGLAESLDYVPLPASLVAEIEAYWQKAGA